jgi:hypothetical protein
MKRGVVALAVVVGGLLGAREAFALELGTKETQRPYHSAQNFALELRFSPYWPQVDDDSALGGKKPYESTFGTSPRFLIGAEFDWQTLRIPRVGTIGPGLGVGYVNVSRSVQTVSGRASGDDTSLSIYPMWAVAVLRADAFYRDLGFPLIPYGKAGIGVARWNASKSGSTSQNGGASGKGTSWGTNLAVGVSLPLDVFDSGASRNMDNITGINTTSIFFEAYWLTLDGLGQKNALHVGTNTWSMGLAFEF